MSFIMLKYVRREGCTSDLVGSIEGALKTMAIRGYHRTLDTYPIPFKKETDDPLGNASFNFDPNNAPEGFRLSEIQVELAGCQIADPHSRTGEEHNFLLSGGFTIRPAEGVSILLLGHEEEKTILVRMELHEGVSQENYKRCFCHALLQIQGLARVTKWVLRALDAERRGSRAYVRRSLGEIFESLGAMVTF